MNTLCREEKEEIALRAKTLHERLNDSNSYPENKRADEVIEEWCEKVADGNSELFSTRLRRENLSLHKCKQKVVPTEWPSDRPLPRWVEELDDIIRHAQASETRDWITDEETEVEFFDILKPFISYAYERVASSVEDITSESGVQNLTEWLATRLSSLFSHTLFIEFKTYIHEQRGDTEVPEASPSDTEYYDSFVSRTQENLPELFIEYSFLGRLTVTVVEQWASNIKKLYDRIAEDWEIIQSLVSEGQKAERIVGVDALGDHHVGGRRVIKLEFDSGDSIAYKPRNSGIAAGFNDLLRWINANSQLPDFETAEVICRGDYSWMEWIEPEGCSTMQDVTKYYRRAGMLICLFYATNVVDMHLENVISWGPHPIIIDLETLAHPKIKDEYLITHREADQRDTVLRTGAVPDKETFEDAIDISCFSTNTVEFTSDSHTFENINSDAMEMNTDTDIVAVGNNLPRFDGEVVGPAENVQAITKGFREMYEYILENKDRIVAEDGPITRLGERGSRVSLIYRNSRNYSVIQKILTHQSNLRTGLQFGVKVESLAKPLLSQDVEEAAWSVYDYERRVLRNWNCPRFTANVTETGIRCRDNVIANEFLEKKPINQIKQRISEFDRNDLREQEELVRRGFAK